ncbi:hypothetical protein [Lysinibacillus sp. FW12]|uniref:hypothetical protein n=1 Tax=Lysinibacillus sp. FW12 TaxID=3096079 RepID=UPI003D74748F
MVNKVFISILLVFIAIFLGGLYSLISHFFIIDSTIVATIFGGVLSMFGGAFGAFGAYSVAKYQMDKEKELYEEREIINARPIISCMEFKGPAKLRNIAMNKNARILATHFYDSNVTTPVFNFYEIKALGNNKGIYDCKVKVLLDNIHKEHAVIEGYLGIIENDTEVFIPLPHVQEGNVLVSSTISVELEFETEKNEKMRYHYNVDNKSEKYFLLKGEKEILIKEIKLKNSEWILPGRTKSPN